MIERYVLLKANMQQPKQLQTGCQDKRNASCTMIARGDHSGGGLRGQRKSCLGVVHAQRVT
jgi:hypothetical protein